MDSNLQTKTTPRPLKIEAHVLAYLGDFMNIFEASVKRLANSLTHQEQSPSSQ
jgi:hypothetical protein